MRKIETRKNWKPSQIYYVVKNFVGRNFYNLFTAVGTPPNPHQTIKEKNNKTVIFPVQPSGPAVSIGAFDA
jgi:hypothetical protein